MLAYSANLATIGKSWQDLGTVWLIGFSTKKYYLIEAVSILKMGVIFSIFDERR